MHVTSVQRKGNRSLVAHKSTLNLSPAVLFVLAMAGGFAPFAIDAYLPGLPAISDDFGVPASQAQLTLTGFMVALGLMQLIIGPLSDQMGRRTLFLIGVFGSAVASVACAIAPNIWVLIAARILQGALGAAGVVLSRAIVADLASGPRLAKAFALLMSVQSLAPVIAPILGGIIVPTAGWRAVFWFLAAMSFVLGIAGVVLVRESLPPKDRRNGGPAAAIADMAHLVRTPHYIAPMLMFTASFVGLFSYVSASPFILQNIIGLSELQFSIAFGVNSAMILVGNLISSRVVERFGPLSLITMASYLTALMALWLAVAILALDTAAWAVMLGFFFIVFAAGFLLPNAASTTVSAAGRRAGAGSAMMGAAQFLLAAMIAPLTGIGNGSTAIPFLIVLLVAVGVQQIVLRFMKATYHHPLEHPVSSAAPEASEAEK